MCKSMNFNNLGQSPIRGQSQLLIILLLLFLPSIVRTEEGIVAHYNFDESEGEILHDISGNSNDGNIVNAKWVETPRGFGLQFGYTNSYIKCSSDLGNKLSEDATIIAWVKLSASIYPDGTTNWTIVDGENYPKSGFVVRVDGQACKLYYRSNNTQGSDGSFSSYALDNNTYYHVVIVKKGKNITYYLDGVDDTSFTVENPALSDHFTISNPAQSFNGIIDELILYNRALSNNEVVASYKKYAEVYGKDTSWFGKLKLQPFFYFDQSKNKMTVNVNFMGIIPLKPDEKVSVELNTAQGSLIQVQNISNIPDKGEQDVTFVLFNLPDGDYQIRAMVKDKDEKIIVQEAISFRYPLLVDVPSPSVKTLPYLPVPPQSLPYNIHVNSAGGFTISIKGNNYPVESFFSYPQGGYNTLLNSDFVDEKCEEHWQVNTKKLSSSTYEIEAFGNYYTLTRLITLYPNRINIKDTFTNKDSDAIGIFVQHKFNIQDRNFDKIYFSGSQIKGKIVGKNLLNNPTIFLSKDSTGIGLVALDDVFIVQSKGTMDEEKEVILHTDNFALDKNSSYTLEWAIYLTPTEDYYDFINAVRKDEGRTGKIDGGIALLNWGRHVRSKEYVNLRNLKYFSIATLKHIADDPGISVDGIDFMEYPKEMKLLKEQISDIHKAYPGMKVMFHVAHSLYSTNKPDEKFPDSRLIDRNGKQALESSDYAGGYYFSEERRKEGWNWYIYYPTLDNSFGKALLKSVDVMVDELGCNGVFMDGFSGGYGGSETYDRWDGHTAEIDPNAKTIIRKIGSVFLLSQDAMVTFARKMRDKGGVVIANNPIITRTMGRETYIIYDREITPGPEIHLAPNVSCLGNPYAIKSEIDMYYDVLDKLKWGNLYIFYGEFDLTYPSVPAQMYPFTFEEIHSYYVKGKERLITALPGLYGWNDNKYLHFVYLYDTKGENMSHNFFTTVDNSEIRTYVDFTAKKQCVVIKKVPIIINTSNPVNVIVTEYSSDKINIVLNGNSKTELIIKSGEFIISSGAKYIVQTNDTKKQVNADKNGVISFTLDIKGKMDIKIEKAIP